MKLILCVLLLLPLQALAGSFTIGVLSDMNGTECQAKYPSNSLKSFDRLLATENLDHIVMSGDVVHGECLSYSGETPYRNIVESMWSEFDFQFVQKSLRKHAIFPIVAPGNHDAPFIKTTSRETFKIENLGFKNYWQQNRNSLKVQRIEIAGANDNFPYYWSYKVDGILFIVLQSTTTSSLANGTKQKQWLRALLNSTAAKDARFKIAFGHIPPYAVLDPSVGSKAAAIMSNEQVGKPNGLMDLMLDGRVDLLIVGHSHAPYPATLKRASDKKSITVLSMPCAHAPRKLYSTAQAATRGFAVLKVTDSNTLTVAIREFREGKLIPHSYFPASIPITGLAATYKRASAKIYATE